MRNSPPAARRQAPPRTHARAQELRQAFIDGCAFGHWTNNSNDWQRIAAARFPLSAVSTHAPERRREQ